MNSIEKFRHNQKSIFLSNLQSWCDEYLNNFSKEDTSEELKLQTSHNLLGLTFGLTNVDCFVDIIKQVNKPKRFIVFGCSIGYQCFAWNHLNPDIPCIGLDVMKTRIEYGKTFLNKYDIKNVELISQDFRNFDIEDGDLIWSNNLLFNYSSESDQELVYDSYSSLMSRDVEVLSYKINENKDKLEFFDKKMGIRKYILKVFHCLTSWSDDSKIYYYQKDLNINNFDVEYVLPEFRIPVDRFSNYESLIESKKEVKSEILRYFYNKKNMKLKFQELGFNVPKMLYYSKNKENFMEKTKDYKSFVVKPAHFSWCESVYLIKDSSTFSNNFQKIEDALNAKIDMIDEIDGKNIYWKNTEPGIIVEEYIDKVYELKVFVVFGEPIIADLRTSPNELLDRVDIIGLNNKYFDWSNEYHLIKKLAYDLKIDFFRVDFLFDGSKLYANECSFMPSTKLPEDIERFILSKIRTPYFKHYYSFLV